MALHTLSGPDLTVPGETNHLAVPVNDTMSAGSVGSKSRTLLQRAIEIAISLACVVLALRGVRLSDLTAALGQANYLWLAPFVGCTVVVLLLKAWRWQLLFYPEHRLPFGSLFSILSVSYLVSNVLPGRVGELARVVLVPAEHPVGPARTVSTIVVERLLDLLSVLFLLVCLLPFAQLPEEILRPAQILGLMGLAGAMVMVVLSCWKAQFMSLAHSLFGKVRLLDRQVVYDALEHLLDGFAMLRSRTGLFIIALALLSWAGVVASAWAAAQSLHLVVPLTSVTLAVVASSLSMVVPSTPGYIGVFEAAVLVALLPLGVPKPAAISYALVWHSMNYLTLTVAGMLAMMIHGISFQQVMSWRKR